MMFRLASEVLHPDCQISSIPTVAQSSDVQDEKDYPGLRRTRKSQIQPSGATAELTRGVSNLTLQEGGRRSIFKQEIEENLETEEREWLTESLLGKLFQGGVVLLFMLMDAIYPLSSAHALEGKDKEDEFIRASVLVTSSVLSITIGCALALYWGGLKGVRQIGEWRNWILYAPGAGCFGAQQLLMLEALVQLGPSTVMVLGNLGLPVSTILRKFTVGKGQSLMQWNAVLLTTTTAIAFSLFKNAEVCSDSADPNRKSEGSTKGVLFMFCATCFGCCGGLFMELMLKKTARDQPMYVQKAYIEIPQGTVTLFIGLMRPIFLKQPIDKLLAGGIDRNDIISRGFFVAWDHKVVVMMLVFTALTWLITGIARSLDSIIKCIAQTASMVCVYLAQVAGGMKSSPGLLLMAVCVAQSSLTYAMSPSLPPEEPPNDARETKPQDAHALSALPGGSTAGADASKGPLLHAGTGTELGEVKGKVEKW